MKRTMVFIIALALLSQWPGLAQNPGIEKLNAYKIAFITKRLNLTSQEAEKFWPVYNDYQDRKFKLQQERMTINRTINQSAGTLSEKELIDLGDKWVNIDVDEAQLLKEFHGKLKSILPPAKIVRLYQAEGQYRQQLLNELQNRRQGNRQAPAGRPGWNN